MGSIILSEAIASEAIVLWIPSLTEIAVMTQTTAFSVDHRFRTRRIHRSVPTGESPIHREERLENLITVIRKQGQLFLALMALIISVGGGPASTRTAPMLMNEYDVFWRELENIFIYRPTLIRDIFYGVVDLKDDRTVAKSYIDFEVLGCPVNTETIPGCRIDRLRLERNRQKLTESFTIPVVFSEVTDRPYGGDPSKRIVTLRWSPILFQPPLVTTKRFFDYIGAAENSKYYQVQPELNRIQIVPRFQTVIELTMSIAAADNLMTLYRDPPRDFRDTLTFTPNVVRQHNERDLAVFGLEMKCVTVRINQQTHSVPEYRYL
jgi:hypothetical protein